MGLEIISPEPFNGGNKEKGSEVFTIALTVPEVHSAYRVFLTGDSESLEIFLSSKLREHLTNMEVPPPCKLQQVTSLSENKDQGN